MIAEYQREYLVERIKGSQEIAIEEGRVPVGLIPGLRRRRDGTVEIDPYLAPVVVDAVRMRAEGATVEAVRDYLIGHGVTGRGGRKLSYHGTTCLLRSEQLVGRYTFGEHDGEIPALVDRDTWIAVQDKVHTRGRKPKSDRLLARLGVLRCAHCGARMVVGTVRDGRYPFYRCPPTADCDGRRPRPKISAAVVERAVWDEAVRLAAAVKESLSDAPARRGGRGRAAGPGQLRRRGGGADGLHERG